LPTTTTEPKINVENKLNKFPCRLHTFKNDQLKKSKNIKIEPRIEVLFVFEVVPSALDTVGWAPGSASD